MKAIQNDVIASCFVGCTCTSIDLEEVETKKADEADCKSY